MHSHGKTHELKPEKLWNPLKAKEHALAHICGLSTLVFTLERSHHNLPHDSSRTSALGTTSSYRFLVRRVRSSEDAEDRVARTFLLGRTHLEYPPASTCQEDDMGRTKHVCAHVRKTSAADLKANPISNRSMTMLSQAARNSHLRKQTNKTYKTCMQNKQQTIYNVDT